MTWGTISGGPINFFTWNSLYPYNYSSNYGGQYQFNVMPSYLTPSQAFGIQNVFNPFYHFTQMNASLYSMMNPFANMQQMMLGQAAYASGVNIGITLSNQNSVRMLTGDITSLKGQLKQALESDKLTDEQKDKLNSLLAKLEALENKLKDLTVLQQQGADPQSVKAALSELNNEFKTLRDDVQKTAQEIKTEIEEGEEAAEETTPGHEGAETTEPQGDTDPQGNVDTLTKRKEARIICDAFADSIDGWGTKDKDFEAALSAINSDNVIEVMQQWNKTYKEEYNETFMETFMWDADHGQKRDFGKYILEQLQERADAAGIDIDRETVKIRRELNSWWIKNNISKDFDALFERIVAAENAEK